ncbi:hypothetical protein [Streptomyces asiaticus]|uniref:hypothetical protein n=1 Tax=Streptomyces asiaticus TaxID=114695 RepID=UPI00380630BD
MAAQPIEHPAVDLRDGLMAALSVAEHIAASAPVIPASIDARTYSDPVPRTYGLSVHLRSEQEVRDFAAWVGAEVTTEPRDDGRWKSTVTFEASGVPVQAWALHTLKAVAA